MHCKRQATPGKQGDDGWKSVLYNGTPLDTYRARYLRLAKSHGEGGTPSVQVLIAVLVHSWVGTGSHEVPLVHLSASCWLELFSVVQPAAAKQQQQQQC